jgi:hypothetical protein
MGKVREPVRTMPMEHARAVVVALVTLALVALAAGAAIAQTTKPGAAPAKTRAPAHPPAVKKTGSTGDGGAPAATGAPPLAPLAPTAIPGTNAPNDAGVVEARTLDGGTRVFKFSELDIEGRLKSPQLVYFLRRVRAEFSAGDLGHRTFMREMSETRKESSF